MQRAVQSHFVPVKINVSQNADLCQKLRVNWTPTLAVIDAEGMKHHRWVGFLPPDEFAAHLTLGLGRTAFNRGDFDKAAGHFEEAVRQFPKTEAAPEAQYWLAVSRYKRTKDRDQLVAGWKALAAQYPQSGWTKRVGYLFEA